MKELNKVCYNCGDLICDNDICMVYNAITRHISGDINMPAYKVYEEYQLALKEVEFCKNMTGGNKDYELDYKGIVESLIEFFINPNLEKSYGYKDLVNKINK